MDQSALAKMYRKLYLAGFAVYAILFILSLLMYKERMIFTDSAYYIFHIVKDNTFTIQHQRYGAMFTELLAVLARKCSFSLDSIIRVYSASFVFYYALCYWLCGSILKNHKLALSILLLNTLFVSGTFYFMLSELPMGIAFLIVLCAYMSGAKFETNKGITFCIVLAGLIGLNLFHPLMILCVAYVFSFFMFRDRDSNKIFFIVSGCLFVLIYLVKGRLFKSVYDSTAMEGLKNFKLLFPHYFGLASNRRFLSELTSKYYWLAIFFIAIIIKYVTSRQWMLLFIFVGSFIGYCFLTNVSHPHAIEASFYMENLYLPLGLIVGLPLIYDILPLLAERKMAGITWLAILLTCGIRICAAYPVYAERLNWERRFLDQNPNRKLLMSDKLVPADTLMMTWSTPYEFWLLSTIEKGNTASILINEAIPQYEYAHWENKEFITPWGNFPYESLDKRYFKFTDSVNHYEYIK